MSEASNAEPLEAGDALLASVLGSGAVQDMVGQYVELAVDAFVDEALDKIPVVSTLRGIAKGAGAFRDAWFTKKLVVLLHEVESLGPPENDWRHRLDTDPDFAADTGERLLAIVDRAASVLKARLVGRAMRQYLDRRCDWPTLMRAVEMIDNALTSDLEELQRPQAGDPESASTARLEAVGLLTNQAVHLVAESIRPSVRSPEALLLTTPR